MKSMSVMAALASTAAATYLLDPVSGRRRRAIARDKILSGMRQAERAGLATAIDLAHRTRGLTAELRARVVPAQIDDEVLAERVKAKLGRVLAHPGCVAVGASAGTVTLKGPVLAEEAERVRSAVRRVTGVLGVEDQLQEHAEAGDVPELQGPARVRAEEDWSPATRTLVGMGGVTLIGCALAQRTPLTALLGVAGGIMLLCAGTDADAE